MFGCIVAGRLVQTNLQQVDVNKYVFELADPATVNHIVVFLLGTIPFETGFAATVHFQWPGGGSQPWQMLGMLSNQKPSAVFRVRNHSSNSTNGGHPAPADDSMMMTNDTTHSTSSPTAPTSVPAILGISIEPQSSVEAQYAQIHPPAASASSTNAVVAWHQPPPPGKVTTATVVKKVMENLYNFVTSFVASEPGPSTSVGSNNPPFGLHE
ncbi:hypothetical protein H4R33_005985 [Dimargaris cristalligena]|nr:hypothetical protein H4R33_005985 [Dimargaris cristalligena]